MTTVNLLYNCSQSWNKHFFPRNLIALSTNPLLVEPAWYGGHPGHYTDTDDAYIVQQDEQDGHPGQYTDTDDAYIVQEDEQYNDDQQIIKDEL